MRGLRLHFEEAKRRHSTREMRPHEDSRLPLQSMRLQMLRVQLTQPARQERPLENQGFCVSFLWHMQCESGIEETWEVS